MLSGWKHHDWALTAFFLHLTVNLWRTNLDEYQKNYLNNHGWFTDRQHNRANISLMKTSQKQLKIPFSLTGILIFCCNWHQHSDIWIVMVQRLWVIEHDHGVYPITDHVFVHLSASDFLKTNKQTHSANNFAAWKTFGIQIASKVIGVEYILLSMYTTLNAEPITLKSDTWTKVTHWK